MNAASKVDPVTEKKATPFRRVRGTWQFEYNGHRYFVATGSDTPTRDGSRYIARIDSDEPGDWVEIASGFGYMSEVRELVARAEREGWDDLGDENIGPSSQPGAAHQ